MEVRYSDDFFKTSKTLVKGGNKFLITPWFIFVAKVIDQATQEIEL